MGDAKTKYYNNLLMMLKTYPLHFCGKDNTWKIERKNLNFRTHIKRLQRKTICFSKNEQIHDNVIGLYIERYYFRYGKFSNSD